MRTFQWIYVTSLSVTEFLAAVVSGVWPDQNGRGGCDINCLQLLASAAAAAVCYS